MEWMDSDLAGYFNNDEPDIIFIHLLVPHPPLFLSADCEPDWRNGLPGFEVGRADMDEQTLAAAGEAYIQQVECVNSVLLRLANNLSPEAALVIIGDHGPDIQGQMLRPGTDWNEDERAERYGVFFAARVPGCDMSSLGSVVNTARRAISCLSGDQFADLPTRIFEMEVSPDGKRVFELEVTAS
jgi:hypothetical protein